MGSKGWIKTDLMWQLAVCQTWKDKSRISKLDISAVSYKPRRRRATTVRIDMVKDLFKLDKPIFRKASKPTETLEGFTDSIENKGK